MGCGLCAGACIGLISLALIDHSNALIYYMDDQMKYPREMLIADIPQFLAELDKLNNRKVNSQKTVKPNGHESEKYIVGQT